MLEKIPLLNSPKTPVKVIGVVLYGFVGLFLLGAMVGPQEEQTTDSQVLDDSEYDSSSFGQTGQVQYATPEGTVTVNLPTGFYLRYKFGSSDGSWSINAAKTASDCVYGEPSTGAETNYCPGHSLEIIWGTFPDGQTFDSRINLDRGHFGSYGDRTEIASGQNAWIFGGNDPRGFYAAEINYSGDDAKLMTVIVRPITDDSPSQSMTPNEFRNFIESINIK